MIKSILIANRGEIAIRIIRACRELGIKSIAVYSEADLESPHIHLADEAYLLGPAEAIKSYLNINKIIEIAKKYKADAIHPGYGFLAENPEFALACEQNDLIFIGPPSSAIAKMGSKTTARKMMLEAGVPIIPGSIEPVANYEKASGLAENIGYPILLKAVAGGGGKGMRIVQNPQDLPLSFRAASSEANSAFGDPSVYVEKLFQNPRHIEIQILADKYGNCIHLFERECSIQRRHQKVIEESPSCALDEETRLKMGEIAVRAAKACGYVNAGTVEFLFDEQRNFYFLEMNTRLQVEHPVTELITGIDIVHQQIAIAEGMPLKFKQGDISRRGHSIECRIYAEDPENDFMPSPGKILYLKEPSGPGVRLDSGVIEGNQIPIHYDPLIAKLIVWGADREKAIVRMKRALDEYVIAGVKTTIPFYRAVMNIDAFIKGEYNTSFVLKYFSSNMLKSEKQLEHIAIMAALLENSTEVKGAIASHLDSMERPSPWRISGRIAQFKSRL